MKLRLTYLVLFILALTAVNAQEENPFITYDVPSQNLLKFNRFMINPTFSTVRENKSYINVLHRNQSVEFDDNNQTYFLSYSGRINDRTGLGLSLYTQREGTISNYGVLANYAYGIKLSDKSNFTFGANLSYYSSGFDETRANPVETDPLLGGFQDNSLLTFQPGFNLSYGPFDFGMFAENLFDYNLKTSESITEFKDKTFSSHLQYTHAFETGSGIFEDARIMPLARVRKVGEDELVLGGNLILDLPKVGWLQGGYDSFYGASAGIGFNLNRRLSLGYTMEKALSNTLDNFGVTHEISFAYSFTPNLTEDRVMLEDEEDALVNNDREDMTPESLTAKDEEIQDLKRRLEENDAILAELIYRQDSMEMNQQKDLERRFEMVMRMVRQETRGERPDLEERAKQMYYINNDLTAVAAETGQKLPTEEPVKEPAEVEKTDLPETTVSSGVAENIRDPRNKTAPKPVEYTPSTPKDRTNVRTASSKVAYKPVQRKKFRDLQDVQDGYYVVANVYRGTKYMYKFIDELKSKGIDANFIDNKNNGMKYVYLKRYNSWNEALKAYRSSMDGAYTGEVWIMNVENRYRNDAYAANSEKVSEKAAEYETDVLRKNVVVRDKMAANGTEAEDFDLKGIGSAYYIIANVFANPKNANRFVKFLNSKGLNASYFINPKNNYRYVYLKRHNSWNNALISYYTKLNDTYVEKMWIMRVKPNLIT